MFSRARGEIWRQKERKLFESLKQTFSRQFTIFLRAPKSQPQANENIFLRGNLFICWMNFFIELGYCFIWVQEFAELGEDKVSYSLQSQSPYEKCSINFQSAENSKFTRNQQFVTVPDLSGEQTPFQFTLIFYFHPPPPPLIAKNCFKRTTSWKLRFLLLTRKGQIFVHPSRVFLMFFCVFLLLIVKKADFNFFPLRLNSNKLFSQSSFY